MEQLRPEANSSLRLKREDFGVKVGEFRVADTTNLNESVVTDSLKGRTFCSGNAH